MRRDDLCSAVRKRLKRLPAPHRAHYGVVPPPPPEASIPLGRAAARHEAARAALAEADALAAGGADPYLTSRVLARREAVSSSSIEGTNGTLREVLSIEEGGDGEAGAEARQARDYAAALDRLVPRARARGHTVFTVDLVRSLHRAVVRADPDHEGVPGALRDRVVWVGGRSIASSSWTPPPPEDVEPCLRQTVDYLRNEGLQSMTQGPITRLAVAHAHFEAVHPFRDGNGRVGRLLLPLMMAADGHVPLYLSPYIEAHKEAYFQSLKDAQRRLDWPSAIGFLSDAIVGTVDELMATRRALEGLRRIWLGRRPFRGGSAARRALALLPQYPVVTVRRLAALLGVSVERASVAVDQLRDAGILSGRTGRGRNGVFMADEVLAIVDRPFGEEPELPQDGAAPES